MYGNSQISALVLGFMILSFGNCSRGPNQLFYDLLGEIPESVILHNSQDILPLDCCIWLHFSISETDYERLFNDYYVQKLDYQKWSSVTPPEVDWWKVEDFGVQGIYLEKISEGGNLIEGVYTNTKRNEVYYVSYHN